MSSPLATEHLRLATASFRHLIVGAPLAAVLLAAAPASAQDPPSNCPPGSWFCAEAEKAPAPAPKAAATGAAAPAPPLPPAKGELEPLPPAEALPPPPPPGPPPAPPGVMIYRPANPPPVVIYQPPPPAYGRPPPPPPFYYRPRPRPSPVGKPNEWGINLRSEIVPNGGGSASRQPMSGVGFGLRYKPVPAFGIEAGFDFLGGHDYQDNVRHETEFTVNAMVFVNPRSRVQFYLVAGLGGAWANVEPVYWSGSPNQANYTYFGGDAGGGLEFRIARHFAMNIDVRGFLRSRTDSNASYQPEFTNPATGQTTNTSDGALLTAGMTFYF